MPSTRPPPKSTPVDTSTPTNAPTQVYRIEAYLPTSARLWIDKKLKDLRILLIENGILANTPPSGSESKELEAARAALTTAQESLDTDTRQLTEHRDDLSADYGADDIFRALQGQCIEKDSGEYTYELCWLGATKQKSKKGGAHTTMGNFVSIASVDVDEDATPDGKGLGSGRRVALKYENGQHCWNGPSRSTLVVLACAEKDEVWKVVEEEKCVYRMEVGTSAVCGVDVPARVAARDEL